MNKLGKTILFAFVGIVISASYSRNVSAMPQLYLDQEAQAEQAVVKTAADLTNALAYRNACREEMNNAVASGDVLRISAADLEYKRAKDTCMWQYDQYDNAKLFLENVKKRNATQKSDDEWDDYIKSRGSYEIVAGQYLIAENTVSALKTQIATLSDNLNSLKASGNTTDTTAASINALTLQLNNLNAQLAVAENEVIKNKAAMELGLDDLEKYGMVLFTSPEGNVVADYHGSPIKFSDRFWNY